MLREEEEEEEAGPPWWFGDELALVRFLEQEEEDGEWREGACWEGLASDPSSFVW